MNTNKTETIGQITTEGVDLIKKHNLQTDLLRMYDALADAGDYASYRAWAASLNGEEIILLGEALKARVPNAL